MTTEKIFVAIDDQRIELKGEELEVFLNDKKLREAEAKTRQAEAQARTEAKAAAQAKLAALGLTVEDLQALGL